MLVLILILLNIPSLFSLIKVQSLRTRQSFVPVPSQQQLPYVFLSFAPSRTTQIKEKESVHRRYSTGRADPFEYDPLLRAQVLSEISVIRKMATGDIVKEIKQCGLNPRIFLDRDELERGLASARVRNSVLVKQKMNNSKREKSKAAMLLMEELARIKELDVNKVIRELHFRGVSLADKTGIEDRYSLDVLLAKSRLKATDGSFSSTGTRDRERGRSSSGSGNGSRSVGGEEEEDQI